MISAVDFESVLYEHLKNDDTIISLVADRIFPIVIPQNTKLPCITFQRTSGVPANTLSGHSGLERIDMEIDTWARNYAEAKDIAKAIRAAMPTNGPWAAHLSQDMDLYDSDTSYYRILSRYTVWFLENAID